VAVKQATNVIPIVMPTAADPVKLGLVASLARPGGNVTGLTSLSDELAGKWIQLVKETLPQVSRMSAFGDPAGDPSRTGAAKVPARSMDVSIQVLKVARPDGFESAFIETKKNRSGALIILGSPFFYAHRTRLVELAARHRLPTIYPQREFVEGPGGLMSYGADFHDQFRRAATYVDKILKGAKPADLPVEQPTKFELVINLKTAKALGLTIPPSVALEAGQRVMRSLRLDRARCARREPTTSEADGSPALFERVDADY
jgi:putative tryptophan/tyrosine transport system substrate-binding protein